MRAFWGAISVGVLLMGGSAATAFAQEDLAAPVKLWLSAPEPEICAGAAKIALRIEIENVSTHSVRIDPHRLAFQVSASRDNQVATTTNDSVALVPGDFRELEAGVSYKDKTEFKLSDPIFGVPGVVRLIVRYGQFRDAKAPYEDLWKGTVTSNAVLVRLRECGAGRK
jgi:hypothetical protein